RAQTLGRHDPPFVVAVKRRALALALAPVPAHPVLQRMRTRKGMLAQKGQQVDLALDLALGLDLVDAQQEASLGGLDQVVAVDRTLRDADGAENASEVVLVPELFEE